MGLLKIFALLLTGCLVLILSACSTPQARIDKQAYSFGFFSEAVLAAGFEHQIYRNYLPASAENAILHVYLEGDGRPWRHPDVVAQDPTARSPQMLKLMSKDLQPSLYLGRPCYHGYYSEPLCHPDLWTLERYSETVVASMTEVLEKIIAGEKIKKVVFYGYSGGGTLAVLLASRISETLAVVTIAGNLDIDAWAARHHYSPLTGSLNPAKGTVLNADIYQLHLVGGEDENIEEGDVAAFVSGQTNAQLLVIAEYDHSCCWGQLWPQVLVWSATVESGDTFSSGRFEGFFTSPH